MEASSGDGRRTRAVVEFVDRAMCALRVGLDVAEWAGLADLLTA